MSLAKFTIAAYSVLLLVSCTTTQQANEALVSQFVGTKTDDFFISYGPPSSVFKLNDGRTVYVWAEDASVYNYSGTSYSDVSFNPYTNSATVNTTTTPGGSIVVQCVLKIVSNTQGVIQQIVAQKDSLGNWQTSRCNEVFNKPNNS